MNCLYLTSVEIDGKSAASNHVVDMIDGLLKNNVDVDLVSATSRLRDMHLTNGSIKFWLPSFKGGWRIFQIQFFVFCLFSGLNKNKYDFVYYRLSPSRTISYALGFIKIFKVMELNGLEIISQRGFRNLIEAADKISISTETSKVMLSKAYPEKSNDIFVNSNVGVTLSRFSGKYKKECREKLKLKDTDFIFLVVSGFQNHHDFDTVLQAFLLFNRENISSRLILVGDGPRKKEIDKKVDSLFKNKEVILTGGLYIDEVSDYIYAADVCLNIMYKSKLEHGNLNAQKTYEYMAVGRPVIETCITDAFIPAWAYERLVIINPEAVDDLFRAFDLLLNNYEFYEKKYLSNRCFILNNFSWDKIASNLINNLHVVN